MFWNQLNARTRESLGRLVAENELPVDLRLDEEERRLLIMDLERSLLTIERLALLLDFFQSTPGLPALSRAESILDEHDIDAALESGLAGVWNRSPARFAEVATDPFALLEIRDHLVARERLPDHWRAIWRSLPEIDPPPHDATWESAMKEARLDRP